MTHTILDPSATPLVRLATDAAVTTPQRIQRKRTLGWRLPPNTVYVGRPTRWGSMFPLCEYSRDHAIRLNPDYLANLSEEGRRELLAPLRGKHLACWCPLDQPCHADELLRLAAEVV